MDERYAVNTKRRYKFPYGDFTNAHRCGLLAVKARAAEHKYHDIEDAAARIDAYGAVIHDAGDGDNFGSVARPAFRT